MKITRELLDKLAHLARLEINEAEAEKTMQDLSEIITWVDKLKEVDTDGVEPLTTMSHEVNVMREDTSESAENYDHLEREKAFQNAPHRSGEFFTVPKVLDEP